MNSEQKTISADKVTSEDKSVAYLVGQFPAINHFYLALEMRLLRRHGIRVATASIASPDRPVDEMRPEERDEVANVYYVKRENFWKTALTHFEVLFSRPGSFLRGFFTSISVARAQRRSPAYGFFYFAEALLVGKWMQRNRISHLHCSFTSSIGLIATKVFPISHSFGVYGFGELYNPAGNLLREKIASSVFVRSVSRHGCGQLMLASPPEDWPKILYLPLGVDLEAFPPRADVGAAAGFEILCVGRLAPEKGQRILISAIAGLAHSSKGIRVRLVGDGPDRKILQQLSENAGISDRIVFEGWVDQARLDELYGTCHAFVLTSLYEGTPIVLMEAMSRQVPCIAPRINGIPEVITHGVNGLLFDPADDVALARLISELIEKPALARQVGIEARRQVQAHYDVSSNTEPLAAIFTQLLSNRNPRNRHGSQT